MPHKFAPATYVPLLHSPSHGDTATSHDYYCYYYYFQVGILYHPTTFVPGAYIHTYSSEDRRKAKKKAEERKHTAPPTASTHKTR